MHLVIASRSSPLAQAQVWEVLRELQLHHPHVTFDPRWMETKGDLDLKTSLRTLGKTDFFTQEIDQMLIQGTCRLAIHSAKDLPDPLPVGIAIAAITQGVDPSDSLVFRTELKSGARIGVSSQRREAAVRTLIPGATMVDIRGNIGQRLALLDTGIVDGLVLAEAALIRLGLTERPRIRLPGRTTPLQGRLAIAIRTEDEEMRALFSCIDRRRVLYLGTDPSHAQIEGKLIHYPVIAIRPRELPPLSEHAFTHVLVTSKNGAALLPERFLQLPLIAVGAVTAETLQRRGGHVILVAFDECQEGVIALLEKQNMENWSLFFPHSSRSRPLLRTFLQEKGVRHTACPLYDTLFQKPEPLPDLEAIDEIVFTSSSTVEAFLHIFPVLPEHIKLSPIGPVTAAALQRK